MTSCEYFRAYIRKKVGIECAPVIVLGDFNTIQPWNHPLPRGPTPQDPSKYGQEEDEKNALGGSHIYYHDVRGEALCTMVASSASNDNIYVQDKFSAGGKLGRVLVKDKKGEYYKEGEHFSVEVIGKRAGEPEESTSDHKMVAGVVFFDY